MKYTYFAICTQCSMKIYDIKKMTKWKMTPGRRGSTWNGSPKSHRKLFARHLKKLLHTNSKSYLWLISSGTLENISSAM